MYPQKSPVHLQKSPVHPQKSRLHLQKSPVHQRSPIQLRSDLNTCVTWLNCVCLWYDWDVCVKCLMHMYVWYERSVCVASPICVYALMASPICIYAFMTYACDMTNFYVCYMKDSCVLCLFSRRVIVGLHVTTHLYMCDMTHLWKWHDSFMYVAWLISRRVIVGLDFNTHLHACDMTHSCRWHDSFMYKACHISRRVIVGRHCQHLFTYVWHDSLVKVTWLIHIWGMTHSWARYQGSLFTSQSGIKICLFVQSHDSFLGASLLGLISPLIYIRVTWHIRACDVTHF